MTASTLMSDAAVYSVEFNPVLVDRDLGAEGNHLQNSSIESNVHIQDLHQKNAMKPKKNKFQTSVPSPKLVSQNSTEETPPIFSLAEYRHTYESNQGPLMYNSRPANGSARNNEAWVDSYLLRQLLRNYGQG